MVNRVEGMNKEDVIDEKVEYNQPLFEDKIMSVIDFEAMDLLIRRVGTFDMALALIRASSEVVKHIDHHTSKQSIVDDIKIMRKWIGPCRLIDILDAQKKVINLIHI